MARVRVTFDEGVLPAAHTPTDLVALDDALAALARMDERRSRVIELRFFGGLTVEETAIVLRRVAGHDHARLAAGQGVAGAGALGSDTIVTPERWQQVAQLYEAAQARPANERAAFLAEACGSDSTLCREVQSLLDQPTSLLQLEGLTPSVGRIGRLLICCPVAPTRSTCPADTSRTSPMILSGSSRSMWSAGRPSAPQCRC